MRFEAKMRVAWNMACGVQLSGSVRYRISSQLLSDGMILNALGSAPDRYRASTLPTLPDQLSTLIP